MYQAMIFATSVLVNDATSDEFKVCQWHLLQRFGLKRPGAMRVLNGVFFAADLNNMKTITSPSLPPPHAKVSYMAISLLNTYRCPTGIPKLAPRYQISVRV